MNANQRTLLKYGAMFVGLVLVFLGGRWSVTHSTVNAAPINRAVDKLPAGYLDSTPEYRAEILEYKAALKELNAMERARGIVQKRDETNGMHDRLAAAIPKGYEWDDNYQALKPQAMTVAPAPGTAGETPKK